MIGISSMFFEILVQTVEQIGSVLNEPTDFAADLVDYLKAVFFQSYGVEFNLLNLLNYKVINLEELIEDSIVLQLQHYLHELFQFEDFPRSVRLLVEKLFEIAVLWTGNQLRNTLFLVTRSSRK